MAMQNPYAKYRNEAVMNASKEELTLMLFEGALKFCNQAIIAIESENDKEKAHKLIIRVQDIIEEFQITLDRSYDIAKELDVLYEYMFRRSVEANIRKDAEILKEVSGQLRTLRDTWKQAMVLAKQKR